MPTFTFTDNIATCSRSCGKFFRLEQHTIDEIKKAEPDFTMDEIIGSVDFCLECAEGDHQDAEKANIFKEFPIAIPPRALALGMVDVSWHNDAGPRMVHDSQADIDSAGDERPILQFFCGGQWMIDEVGHGYWIGYFAYGCEPRNDLPALETDSLDAALAFLETEVAAVKAGARV